MLSLRKALIMGGSVLLVGLLVFLLWPEQNLSSERHAVPRMAVGKRTFAIARLDLAQAAGLSEATGSALQANGNSSTPNAPGDLQPLLQALANHGVTQIVLPVNLEIGSGEGVGVYLGGQTLHSSEDIESAVLQSGVGKAFKVLSLFSAISPCGAGWRFWGLGSGVMGKPDSRSADRFEDAFRAAGDAVAQVIVLGSSHDGASAPAAKPSDPRIVRQMRRLATTAEGLDSFRLALMRDPAQPGVLRHEAAALFADAAAANRFVASWRNLAGDLAATAAPSGEPGLLDRVLSPVLRGLTNSVPRAEGRLVKWGADDRAPAAKS